MFSAGKVKDFILNAKKNLKNFLQVAESCEKKRGLRCIVTEAPL